MAVPEALGTMAEPGVRAGPCRAGVAELDDVDVIHDHRCSECYGPIYTRPGFRCDDRPRPVHPRDGRPVPSRRSCRRRLVSVSYAQRNSALDVPVKTVIHHGVDVARFPFGRGDGGHALFLGRMSPGEGRRPSHRGRSGRRTAVLLAAKMWEPAEHRYFADCVAPLLGDDAVYVGEVGGERELRLLAGAEALVNPIRWPEPFGLVMIEAMAYSGAGVS